MSNLDKNKNKCKTCENYDKSNDSCKIGHDNCDFSKDVPCKDYLIDERLVNF